MYSANLGVSACEVWKSYRQLFSHNGPKCSSLTKLLMQTDGRTSPFHRPVSLCNLAKIMEKWKLNINVFGFLQPNITYDDYIICLLTKFFRNPVVSYSKFLQLDDEIIRECTESCGSVERTKTCQPLLSLLFNTSDVPIIGNNRLINQKSCRLWWSILIFNNRSSDTYTKRAITRFICTTRPQSNEVSDTDSHGNRFYIELYRKTNFDPLHTDKNIDRAKTRCSWISFRGIKST